MLSFTINGPDEMIQLIRSAKELYIHIPAVDTAIKAVKSDFIDQMRNYQRHGVEEFLQPVYCTRNDEGNVWVG
jgi:hypothetical protein